MHQVLAAYLYLRFAAPIGLTGSLVTCGLSFCFTRGLTGLVAGDFKRVLVLVLDDLLSDVAVASTSGLVSDDLALALVAFNMTASSVVDDLASRSNEMKKASGDFTSDVAGAGAGCLTTDALP